MKIPSTLTLAVSVLIAIGVLAGAAWALGAVARPKDYAARLAAVDQMTAEIAKSAPALQASAYGAGSLCKGAALTAAADLRGQLMRRAGEAGVVLKQVAVTPAAPEGALPGLAAIEVSFSAEGPYDGARRLIGALGVNQPEIFIDRVELRPTGGAIRLQISGRAFCSISARR